MCFKSLKCLFFKLSEQLAYKQSETFICTYIFAFSDNADQDYILFLGSEKGYYCKQKVR